MFEGFALKHVQLEEVSLRLRHGGYGPPVLLLHGHPRTHTTWHRVAPLLITRSCALICAATDNHRSHQRRLTTSRTPSVRWPATASS